DFRFECKYTQRMIHKVRAPIAITMGDPSGIGPEIIVKLFNQREALPPAIVIGDTGIFRRTVEALGLSVGVRTISAPEEAYFNPGTIEVIQSGETLSDDLPIGQIDSRSGCAAFDAILSAIKLARAGRVNAITTAPINKE